MKVKKKKSIGVEGARPKNGPKSEIHRSNTITKILIVNFFSRLNKGSAALLNSEIKLLRNFGHVTIVVSTHHPEIKYTCYDIKMVKVSGKAYPLTVMAGKLVLSALCGLDSVLSKYLGVRLKISIGGRRLGTVLIYS